MPAGPLTFTVGRQKQNEFGFVVGGPIVEDHAFFMMNYTGYDYKQFGEEINTVQTDLMRGGNFTEILGDSLGTDVLARPVRAGQIYDPMTTRRMGRADLFEILLRVTSFPPIACQASRGTL